MTVFIEFADPGEARRALQRLSSLGYFHAETYGPYPLTDEDAHAPRGSIALALVAFGGGVSALVAAYLIQWFANVASYPLNIGGRPAHAVAAFVPTAFESICVAATLALFVAFLALERLPRLWQPVFEIDGFERASIDRFWIVFELPNSETVAQRLMRDVAPLLPLRVVTSEDER